MKKLGPVQHGGDGNEWELTRACPTCEGTGVIPPKAMWVPSQNASAKCTTCEGAGSSVARFPTLEKMKEWTDKLGKP
jgi:DnaJ-class molecular chaperone